MTEGKEGRLCNDNEVLTCCAHGLCRLLCLECNRTVVNNEKCLMPTASACFALMN